ncbi:ATP-dependent DNA helicase PIF1-like [Artemia franciscana]|uniref:ATP-dependent DNA helicase PIF1 n=1 Tax=Artemia franciscana TaxID=6661 RepID=A0AA88L7X5_ARTSF|nr:hypothetical protein QYM36_004213 [Artemia franciscana]
MDSSPKLICPEVPCIVQVQPAKNPGSKGRIIKNAKINLGRNQFRDVILLITSQNSEVCSFTLNAVKVHKNFIHEGKATILLINESLMISNAPPRSLQLFVKTLTFKVALQAKKTPIASRCRLLATKLNLTEEISPLTSKDIAALSNKVGTETTPTRKKGQPLKQLNTQENCNRIEAIKKRRLEMNNGGMSPQSQARASLKRFLSPHQLTEEQKNVLTIVLSGKSIFFTGSAGTGKSYLLRRIVGSLPPDATFVTASTGIAACHIDGTTLHSFAGIGSGKATLEQCLELARRPTLIKQWKSVKHLIIDEVSMVDGDFFEKLEVVARKTRDTDLPFGGIQLILCGDFLQLPPVVRRGETRRYAFQTAAWENSVSKIVELKQVHRQADKEFIKILSQIRSGRCSSESAARLKSTAKQTIEKDGIIPTILCTHTDDVEHINMRSLDKLPGTPTVFKAVDSDPYLTKQLDQLTSVPSTLCLKIGSQIMLMKNLDISRGLVNGARGVIVGFEKGGIIVNFACGVKENIFRERYVVKCSNTLVTRTQLPIRLAWAFSIHKSQGMTLDCVEVTLGRAFEAGQAYVALSRAKSLNSLRVLDFSTECVRADAVVLAFYRDIFQDFY